jgi:hypothetical protein
MTYKVIIEDFGTAHEGTNEALARSIYERYVHFVQHRKISFLANNEVVSEFLPKDSK